MRARLRALVGVWIGACCLAVLATGSAGATSQLASVGSVRWLPNAIAAGPVAGDVSYTGAVGNTAFGVGTTPAQPSTSTTGTVLSNSSGGSGPLSVVSGPITTTGGGHVQMNADGTFTYVSAPGFTGADSFAFTVTDGTSTASATAHIAVAGRVWYVNDAGSNGNGTSTSPFNTLLGAASASAATDAIFLFGSGTPYAGGITLKASQSLIGQSADLVVGGQILSNATGSNPVVTNGAGIGITLGEGDTVSGITVNSTSGAGVSASNVNSFTLSSGDTITAAGADGLDVSAGNGTITDGASISGATAHSVSIKNRTGGTATLSGAINESGTGIVLSGNTNATSAFTGPLTASTGANVAFSSTGAGTITVSGSSNTLATTTATALDVEGTSIGASGLTFQSISAGSTAAGPEHGIFVTGSGTVGGLTVTGKNGVAGSGGTIDNSKSSTNPNSSDNAAVDLGTNTQNSTTSAPIGPVSLTDMAIKAAANGGAYGVYATNVARFTFAGGSVTGEPLAGIFLSGFGSSAGTFSITGNTLTGQGGTPIDVTYPEGGAGTTATGADSGIIANNTIGTAGTTDSGSSGGGDGIATSEAGTGSLVVDGAGNTVSQVAKGYGINANASAGSLDVTLTSNNVQQSNSQSLDGITVGSGSNAASLCLNATTNTSHAVDTNFLGLGFDAVGLSVTELSSAPSFNIQGYTGPSNDAGGQLESRLNSTNTLSGPNAGDGSIASNSGGALAFGGAGVTCKTAAPQTITFNAPAGVTYGAPDIGLSTVASASSNLPLYYTNAVGQCTLATPTTLRITGAGTCAVTANQDGSATFQPATAVTQSFAIAKATLTVDANAAQQAFGAAQPPLTYTLHGFVSPDNATNSNITGAGTCSLAAGTGPGAGTYPGAISCVPGTLAAPNYTFVAGSSATYTITGTPQTITFNPPTGVTYGQADFNPGATASSGLAVTYSNPSGQCTIDSGGLVHVTAAGSCTVTANQAGGSGYLAATPVTKTFSRSPRRR